MPPAETRRVSSSCSSSWGAPAAAQAVRWAGGRWRAAPLRAVRAAVLEQRSWWCSRCAHTAVSCSALSRASAAGPCCCSDSPSCCAFPSSVIPAAVSLDASDAMLPPPASVCVPIPALDATLLPLAACLPVPALVDRAQVMVAASRGVYMDSRCCMSAAARRSRGAGTGCSSCTLAENIVARLAGGVRPVGILTSRALNTASHQLLLPTCLCSTSPLQMAARSRV
mmetsp:Transcript_14108/g.30594  ORF Transcript_14108/g.30594 Transcript_14108/m.30594 type:complete len:225 (-) Transcript_14108:885-1559(-)